MNAVNCIKRSEQRPVTHYIKQHYQHCTFGTVYLRPNVPNSSIIIIQYYNGTLCISALWNGGVLLHHDQDYSRRRRLPTRLNPFPVAACLMDAWPHSYGYWYVVLYELVRGSSGNREVLITGSPTGTWGWGGGYSAEHNNWPPRLRQHGATPTFPYTSWHFYCSWRCRKPKAKWQRDKKQSWRHTDTVMANEFGTVSIVAEIWTGHLRSTSYCLNPLISSSLLCGYLTL